MMMTKVSPLHVHMYYLVRDTGARMHTVHIKQMKKINSKTQN